MLTPYSKRRQEAKQNKASAIAIEKLSQAIALWPDYEEAHWDLALLYIAKKEYEPALYHLGLLQGKQDANWQYHYKTALCYFKTWAYHSALRHPQAGAGFASPALFFLPFLRRLHGGSDLSASRQTAYGCPEPHSGPKAKGIKAAPKSPCAGPVAKQRIRKSRKRSIACLWARQARQRSARALLILALDAFGKAKEAEAYELLSRLTQP